MTKSIILLFLTRKDALCWSTNEMIETFCQSDLALLHDEAAPEVKLDAIVEKARKTVEMLFSIDFGMWLDQELQEKAMTDFLAEKFKKEDEIDVQQLETEGENDGP